MVNQQQPNPRLTSGPIGSTADGQQIGLITLRNQTGIEVRVATYGGIILSLKTPDRNGISDDIVLGFDDITSYFDKSPYFGCLIGRYCNRIAKGKFTLDKQTYTLATNNAPNHLHGGNKGWDKVVWTPTEIQNANGVGVKLTYTSKDGEEGYPGTVTADVTYMLTDKNELVVEYHATTDKPTIINLTQHSYFNMAGAKANDILGHELMLNADQYTPVDATLIPTGELAKVDGTPFDFRTSTKIGARINDANEQLKRGLGLRPQLGREARRRRARPRRAGRRAGDRPDDGDHHHRARNPVLLGQFSRRQAHWQGRPRLRPPLRVLPRNAALPRLTQPSVVPVDDAAAGRRLPIQDRLHVRRRKVGAGFSRPSGVEARPDVAFGNPPGSPIV